MGVSNYSMADIAMLTQATNVSKAEQSTSRKGNTELDMQDFLQLMVVQLQNQTIDNTMDTGEMMSQMVQMQMITAITNMNETSIMTYASSLVGKVVTIGITDGASLEEREVIVTGTGVSNGKQVIFGKDASGKVETYSLNQIMAVGQLPPLEEAEEPGDGKDPDKVEGAEGAEGADKDPDGQVKDETSEQKPAETPEAPQMIESPVYTGEQGVPADV